MADTDPPRMYSSLAGWFHLITPPGDYVEDAALILELLTEALGEPPGTILELGSGGGNNASHLKAHATPTLVDVSPAMLDQSRLINPELEHLVGDMRTIRLGRTFDAVLIHDAICYMTTEADLRAAIETAYVHLRPGGAAVLAPDHVSETYEPESSVEGHDGADGRAIRYLEWSFDPHPEDGTVVTEFAYLLREADGSVRLVGDRHVEGLFPRELWLRLLAESGFEARSVIDPWDRDIFIARRSDTVGTR
ncbi:MAG TPA: class I SAM-dependent methyltransferase [Candidatus Limnocylindrales bacterium]|nr:class I SAM-dependent methyltransferase [Candidatus Limnocylindrales bacterium]